VTSPTGADESMDAPTGGGGGGGGGAATGAAAATEENEPSATTVEPPSSSEDVPLPKTKVITIVCDKKIILKLDTSSLKYSGLAGYSLCQAFCVNQYDTSSTPFQGQCMVNGEKFESQEGAGDEDGHQGDGDQPILVSEREVDQDPVCVSCSDPPLEKVSVPSFWTEELTKSELAMEEDKSEGTMRLPVGRSGHTSTRVDRENVLVFGGESPATESEGTCLSSKGEELLQLHLPTMTWSSPVIEGGGAQPDLSYHTSTLVMLPKDAAEWSDLSGKKAMFPHLFVLGGKTRDCVSGTTSYTDALHVYSVELKKWSRFTTQSNMVESDALDSWDGREGHTTTLVGAYLYIFGGVNDETGFEGKNDLLRMSVRPDPTTSKFAWEIVQHGNNNGGGPTARKGHVAALLSSRFFVIFSGFDSNNAHQDDLWVYDHGLNGILGTGGCTSLSSEKEEGEAEEILDPNLCAWSKPSQYSKDRGGLHGTGPFPRQGASSAVLGEKTAVIGSSEVCIFGGHDDGLRTWFNDVWLLRVKTDKRTNAAGSHGRERVHWYWQATDLDGDSDDDMQIPERRESSTMVYLPSYVHLLSVTDTAYSDLYATNNDQRNQTNLLEIQEDEVMLQREDDHNNKNNKSMIPHGRRVLMVGGTMASSMKANDVFTLEIGKHRPLPPGPPDAKKRK
jgi:hypothetical protein